MISDFNANLDNSDIESAISSDNVLEVEDWHPHGGSSVLKRFVMFC
jgi:hypothetical protein